MLKKALLILACTLLFFEIAKSQDLTLNARDTLYLNKGTHINNTLTDWDSVVTWVMRGTDLVQRVKLTKYATGEYGGAFKPTYLGNFVAVYYAYYGSYKVREEQPFNVLDTTAFMGSAAGLTAREIIDSLEGRSWFPGTGAFACTVLVRDSSLEAGINAVHVVIRNSDESAVIRHGWTNANGKAFFALDSLETDVTYKVWLLQLGYNFTFPETMDVRESATFTFYGTEFNPGSPPSANLCRVWRFEHDINDQPVFGAIVEAKIEENNITYENVGISPYVKYDTTDANGLWSMDLFPNSILTPSNTKYKFLITLPAGKILEKKVSVPVDTSWNLQW
jgi:hypothetical protein